MHNDANMRQLDMTISLSGVIDPEALEHPHHVCFAM
jgi:hypothetical protein